MANEKSVLDELAEGVVAGDVVETEVLVADGIAVVEDSGEALPAIKHIIRYISKQNRTSDDAKVFAAWELDEYLNVHYQMGYVLKFSHYLGEAPEGYGVLYILELR